MMRRDHQWVRADHGMAPASGPGVALNAGDSHFEPICTSGVLAGEVQVKVRALLDRRQGGHFAVRPVGGFTSQPRYVGATNILETTFHTETGTLRLTDLMPVSAEREKRHHLWPARQLLRVVECVDGELEVEARCEPRPDYGRRVPRLRDRGPLGVYYEHQACALVLRSEIPLALSADSGAASGVVRLRRGERRHLSLVFAEGEPAVLASLGAEADTKVRTSLEWWEAWAARCNYGGPYRAAVLRSALTLKLMTHAPSGAVIAAPTTSLPEKLGGVA